MRVVIMGCGRTGAQVAASLAGDGDQVVVIEKDVAQVARLPQSLVDEGSVTVVDGDGTTSETLARAEIEEADVFVAVTGQDTVNGLAAHKAKEIYSVGKVILRVKDPELGELYSSLGFEVLSTTDLGARQIIGSVSEIR